MDTKILVTALILVPLILMLSVAVFEPMAGNSRSTFEVAIVNESTTAGIGAKVLTYPCKTSSITLVTNQTASYTNYTTSYGDGYSADCTVTIGENGEGTHTVSYTSYSGSGYTQFGNVRSGTYNGFSLASMLPYIYIAIAVISIILGAFGIASVM